MLLTFNHLHPGMSWSAFLEQQVLPVERPYGCEDLGSHYQGQRGATQLHVLSK